MAVIAFQYFWLCVVFWFDLISPFNNNFLVLHTLAFNIDEEYPIVIKNRFNGKDAHFGASVLLLPSNTDNKRVTDHSSAATGWIIIGAPKANSTSANHRGIFEPGVIWRCALGSTTNLGKPLCETVDVDPTGGYDPLDRSQPYRDRKDGGWLGGSMFAGDSERFVTCASRWINEKFKHLYLLNGICYWLPKENLMTPSFNDSTWPWLAPKLSYRLMPLVNKTNQYYKEVARTPNTPIIQRNSDNTFDWAFGQFGFSIHLTSNNELIAGAPGTLDWMGSIVYYRDIRGPRPQFRRYNAHASSPAFSEVLVVRSQTLGHLLDHSEYFGYSVTSGHFFNADVSKNKTQIAAGAPRSSGLSGKVLVFTIEEVTHGRSEGRLELLVEPIEGRDTKGNHYGSYFGHSLLALDVNGDGYDDLLVGAPLYGSSNRYKRNAFESTMQEGTDGMDENDSTEEEAASTKLKSSGDEGCVFIYFSTGEEFSLSPQDLCGEQISGARFGMALSSLNDINYDGFKDVVVGAPYENEGRGAVYIYHGGAEFMVLAQKLKPELVDPLIRTFGWSLSAAVDIDNNGYPDLAVGGYESNQVIVYRTVPIVHFTAVLSASIPKLLSSTDEFNLTTCITYSGRGAMPSVLALWVKLTLETELEGRRLVALVDPIDSSAKLLNRNRSSVSGSGDEQPARLLLSYARLLQIRSDGVDSCHNFSAVRVGSVDGPIKSIPIRQEYWLDGFDREIGHSKPIFYEILAKTLNSSLPVVNLTKSKSSFSDFNSKLPKPVGNVFGKQRLVIPVGTICEADGDPACLANLTISATLLNTQSSRSYNASHPFTLGSSEVLTVEIELFNHREVANLPVSLTLQWLQPPVVRRLPTSCEYSVKNSLVCNIRKPIKEGQKTTVALELNMAGVYGGSPEDNHSLKISFMANTSSSLVQQASYTLEVPLRTDMTPQDFHHKSSKIEYFMGNTSIPTFGFTQAFEIGLDGPSSASAVQATFEIPVGFQIPADDGKSENYYRLIGVRKPILTYDGKIKCKSSNGSFLDEEELLGDSNIFDPGSPSEVEDEDGSVFVSEDYSISKVEEAARTLHQNIIRVRRSIWMDQSEVKGHFGGILKLHCDPSAKSAVKTICLQVVCTADHFTPASKAVVEFKLRMFNKVAEKLLELENYKSHAESREIDRIASLWIESLGSVRTLNAKGKPFGPSGSLFFISRLQIPPPYELPAWIIIVSVGGGLLLFTIVTIMLKKCGFFRRSKRDELIRRKVQELERSRLISAPNSPSTASTAGIRTNSSSRHRSTKSKMYVDTSTFSNGGSIMAVSMDSPGTAVKQKDLPGAVDLNELRRLYEYANDDAPLY